MKIDTYFTNVYLFITLQLHTPAHVEISRRMKLKNSSRVNVII